VCNMEFTIAVIHFDMKTKQKTVAIAATNYDMYQPQKPHPPPPVHSTERSRGEKNIKSDSRARGAKHKHTACDKIAHSRWRWRWGEPPPFVSKFRSRQGCRTNLRNISTLCNQQGDALRMY